MLTQMNMNLLTPSDINENIVKFCHEIDRSTQPIFVPVIPAEGVRFNYCLTDVPRHVQGKGGMVTFGWIVTECPRVALQAEFHACWSDPEGQLIDITPKPDGTKKILFLPDSSRTYLHKPVDNIRKALVLNDYTRFWLLVEEKLFELRAKYSSDDDIDDDAANAEFNEWMQTLPKKAVKIPRNDPCICGSSQKYKNCCGK